MPETKPVACQVDGLGEKLSLSQPSGFGQRSRKGDSSLAFASTGRAPQENTPALRFAALAARSTSKSGVQNHCRFCHTPQIHSRPGKLPLTRAELRDIVNHWRRLQGRTWAEQDTEDVVEYLNLTRYRFPVGE